MGIEQFLVSDANQEKICRRLGSSLVDSGVFRQDFWIQFEAKDLISTIGFLRSEEDLAFDSFVDLCGVDYKPRKPRFENVIHLYSLRHRHRIRLRCLVPDDTLTVPSVTRFWKGADWQEREAFDMYGIRYEGHPDLRRILSPPETEIYPQRKDYPLLGSRAGEES